MKIVLYSNILLISIGKRSPYRPIWDAFIDEKYELIVVDEVMYEYEEVLQRHTSDRAANLVLEIFKDAPNVIYQHIYYSWNAITGDPDDNKFFDIAVAANADYLVTNDSHFNLVKNLSFPSVGIITASEFLDILIKE